MLALAVLAGGLVNALLLGFVARRLLGVPVGWPRTLLVSYGISSVGGSALPGLVNALGLPEGPSESGSTAVAVGLVIALGTAWVFALGLALLVVLEAIIPTGSLPNPLVWLRTLKARRRRARRYTQIIGIAARHGLGGFLRGRSRLSPTESRASVARSLSRALTDGGVTFVKLGQMLASRPDLVGEEAARELGALQTQVAAEPWPVIEAAVATELGTPVPEVFADIDPSPLAAASVAQVHAARLLDGTPVVVKVQRPGARAQATADLDIVLRLAGWLERTTSWGRSLGVRGLAAGFAASLEEELDYTVERANTEAVAASLRGTAADTVGVPEVYAAWSGSRLLVMERLEGAPVAEAQALLAGLPDERRAQLADLLLGAVLRQVLVDGVFHADLHQGNVFMDETGRLSLLDFGSVGRLDSGGRRSLGAFLHAVDRGDNLAAADALIDLLQRPERLDDRAFERELGEVVQRFRGGFGPASSSGIFTRLLSLVVRHGFTIPPQVAAALRALGSLEGTLATISPGHDMVTSARAHARDLLGPQLDPTQVRASLEDQLLALAPALQRLPRRLNALGDQLEQGRFSMNLRLLADPRDRSFVDAVVRQLTITVLAAACAICGVVLAVSDAGPVMVAQLRLFTFLGATLFFFAFVLAARALATVFRHTGAPPP